MRPHRARLVLVRCADETMEIGAARPRHWDQRERHRLGPAHRVVLGEEGVQCGVRAVPVPRQRWAGSGHGKTGSGGTEQDRGPGAEGPPVLGDGPQLGGAGVVPQAVEPPGQGVGFGLVLGQHVGLAGRPDDDQRAVERADTVQPLEVTHRVVAGAPRLCQALLVAWRRSWETWGAGCVVNGAGSLGLDNNRASHGDLMLPPPGQGRGPSCKGEDDKVGGRPSGTAALTWAVTPHRHVHASQKSMAPGEDGHRVPDSFVLSMGSPPARCAVTRTLSLCR